MSQDQPQTGMLSDVLQVVIGALVTASLGAVGYLHKRFTGTIRQVAVIEQRLSAEHERGNVLAVSVDDLIGRQHKLETAHVNARHDIDVKLARIETHLVWMRRRMGDDLCELPSEPDEGSEYGSCRQ